MRFVSLPFFALSFFRSLCLSLTLVHSYLTLTRTHHSLLALHLALYGSDESSCYSYIRMCMSGKQLLLFIAIFFAPAFH